MKATIETSGGTPRGMGTFVLILVTLEAVLLGVTYFDTPLRPLAVLCAIAVGAALLALGLLNTPTLSIEEGELRGAEG